LLFRYLHDDAFLAFSREHKHLYAACLLDLHERFFTGAPAFPTPQVVTHAIYDVMRANPSLWNESDDFGEPLPEVISAGRRRIKRAAASKTESSDKALLIARQIYGRLTAWGWLEEEEYGLRVTVDMSMGPLLVIQRLASLNKDVSQRFGGLIVTVRLNLEAVEKLTPQIVDRKQREVALALREARNQVDQFTKSLRAILSDLKRIRRTVMESKTVGDRLEAFFEEFVEQLLLRDFESILTFNHPYRFRDAIVDLARKIVHTPRQRCRSCRRSTSPQAFLRPWRKRPSTSRAICWRLRARSVRSARCSSGSSPSGVSWKRESGIRSSTLNVVRMD
jgi:hypothetical protein